MTVTRNVIIDLLPLYAADEVSADTRTLVEEYLKSDQELALIAQSCTALEKLKVAAIPMPSADLELRSLRRTRGLLKWERLLMAWGIAFTLLGLSSVFYTDHGQLQHQFLLREYPWAMGISSSIGFSCLVNYFLIRLRLRVTRL